MQHVWFIACDAVDSVTADCIELLGGTRVVSEGAHVLEIRPICFATNPHCTNGSARLLGIMHHCMVPLTSELDVDVVRLCFMWNPAKFLFTAFLLQC